MLQNKSLDIACSSLVRDEAADSGRSGRVHLPLKPVNALSRLSGYTLIDELLTAALLAVALILAMRGLISTAPLPALLAASFWLMFAVAPSHVATGILADARFTFPATALTALAATYPRAARRAGAAVGGK